MGIFDKVKNFIDNSDEDTIDEDIENVYDDSADDTYSSDSTESSKSFNDFSASSRTSSISSTPNIVDLRSSSRTPVVLKKLDRYLDVQSVADVLNEKRIVILNLETCPADDSRRIIDFLSGVAYAIPEISRKLPARLISSPPDSVPLSGDVLEDIESMSEGYFD